MSDFLTDHMLDEPIDFYATEDDDCPRGRCHEACTSETECDEVVRLKMLDQSIDEAIRVAQPRPKRSPLGQHCFELGKELAQQRREEE